MVETLLQYKPIIANPILMNMEKNFLFPSFSDIWITV